jgi:hypothetical protein
MASFNYSRFWEEMRCRGAQLLRIIVDFVQRSGANGCGRCRQMGTAVPCPNGLVAVCVIGFCVAAYGARKSAQTVDHDDQRYYANAQTYLDETVEQIVLQIPELRTLSPVVKQDPEVLPVILDKTGSTVSEFFRDVANVIAREKIVEQKFGDTGRGREEVRDNYLILRSASDTRTDFDECRVDEHGKRVDQTRIEKGFFVTSNFALSSIYFSAEYQANSNFRYLGDQKFDGRDAFVVAFAQIPGESSITSNIQGRWKGTPYLVHMLVQGVVWIDKSNFRILRVRTDLLAPRRDIGLVRLTTEVDYGAETLADVPSPLWLVQKVKVYAHFSHVVLTSAGISIFDWVYRNEHSLTDYRRYGVSASVGGEAVTAAQSDLQGDGNARERRSTLKVPPQISGGGTATFVEAPIEEVVKEVSELKSLRVSADQKLLPAILQKTGARVDAFFANIVDLTAREKIVQARLNNRAQVVASHNTEGNYLIVRRSGGTGIEEYRTDANGNRADSRGFGSTGYFVTSSFALNCNYFSTAFQPESVFRYLGTQKVGGRQANVVAFAQKPAEATLAVALHGRNGAALPMYVHGIVWIDEETSQILRLRSDLLTPLWTVGLDRLTTEVDFSEVRLRDLTSPLWLPREVSVRIFMNEYSYENADYYEQVYENRHHYANYQRFRVGVKIGP